MVHVDLFNSGIEIPFVTSGTSTVSCRCTFGNSADTNHIGYSVNINIVVTETIRFLKTKKTYYKATLPCTSIVIVITTSATTSKNCLVLFAIVIAIVFVITVAIVVVAVIIVCF